MPATAPPDVTISAATIGANVRAEMARAGVSQAAMARILNLSQSPVSMRLRGATPFTAHELAAIAHYLDVPVDAFYRAPTT
jgi:transcriptional regulator with XRE-family HTH domain